MRGEESQLATERRRILREYRRRQTEVSPELYAPWNPGARFIRSSAERWAPVLLERYGAFPSRGDRCLEIGYGTRGWLADLLGWGVRLGDLHGIELDASRSQIAKESFPGAHLRVGDAAELPWLDGSFQIVVLSTVLSSILDGAGRARVAREATRVLAPQGAILLYDFRVDNPRNPHVQGIGRREIERLFAELDTHIRSVSLAPPIARRVVPLSWTLATLLECIPFLRTHLLGVLVKPNPSEGLNGSENA